MRHATFADGGGDATERIVEHDAAARTYDYDYLTSRITVSGDGDGAEILWVSEFTSGSAETGEELAEAIGGIYRGGLDHLVTVLDQGA
ncbi:SRPBCC family protein [Pseudonocardia pini]|uniref:SRPBCC family protein n=1 Tax=Pseudonocardia pini TaxID=2758030 RepID=UPI001C68A80B|nr:SRPBCC family protein [Pseudonocardia pini]